MICETAGMRSAEKKSGAILIPAGPIGTTPAIGRSRRSARRSATQPPSELPTTTTFRFVCAAAWSTASSAKSASWSRTLPGPSGGATPKPGWS